MSDKNISPVGWYIGSYVLRFVELDRKDKEDSEARFPTWENTVLVRAADLDEAYEKIVRIGKEHTEPYKGGPDGIDVQWLFEGVTELLPIYKELEDGAEVMWSERSGVKLKNIRKCIRGKGEFHQ